MKPSLYIFLGYPGAGKTSAAIEISKLTGARHLWADKIRGDEFIKPTYSPEENLKLYRDMNSQAADMLSRGESVVFDTAFNLYKDREHMREIAAENNAVCKLIWVKTDRALAEKRALGYGSSPLRPLHHDMSPADFKRISDKLEIPQADEDYTELDGTKITPEYIAEKLGI